MARGALAPTMRRPLLLLAAAFACGAACAGELLRDDVPPLVGLAALLLAVALGRPHRGGTAALCGASLALGAGLAAVEAAREAEAPIVRVPLDGRARELTGRVASAPRCEDGRCGFLLDVQEAGRPAGRVRVDLPGDALGLEEGNLVALWATLRPTAAFATPGSRSGPPDVHRLASCKSRWLVRRLEDPEPGPLVGVRRLRAAARRALDRRVVAGPERAVVRAMVLGDRGGLPPATLEAFRAAGTYHVLALSGAQVALVAWIVLRVAAAAGRGPVWPPLAAAAMVAGYAVFAGGDVPVLRAAVMAGVLLLGRALALPGDPLNLLGASALALLAWQPRWVADVGFHLSFLATAALLLGPPDGRTRGRAAAAWRAVTTSARVQVALAGVLVSAFHRLAPAALLLNLVAVPLSTAVLLAGFVTVALDPAPLLGDAAGDAAWIAAHALLASGQPVSSLGWLDVRLPTPDFLALVAFYGGMAGAVRGRRGALPLLLAGGAGLVGAAGPPADGRLHLTVLDVGQGDALVLRSPHGRQWLVDAGGSRSRRFDLGEAVVAPYLWSIGTRRLDGILATHGHPDHVAGIPFLLRAFPVGELWEGPAPRAGTNGPLEEAARAGPRERRTVVAGVRRSWDGAVLEVVGPARPLRAPGAVRNDDSVVLHVSFGGVSLLLTGDVERRGEERLPPRRVDVLKVAHHGSRTSTGSAFLAEARPRLAVVSAGRDNRFGHPAAEVLERLRRRGVLVLRTDVDGTVSVSTDGRSLWVRSAADGLERRLP